ncbi:MAG: hypothetical protein WCC48_08560 [Anaeromyxobacteraceae bacterium]
MAELKLWGSRGTVRDGYVEINTGQESTVGFVLGGALILAYVFMLVAVITVIKPPHSLWYPVVNGSIILVLHGALRILRRRGDDFFMTFRRQPPGSGPPVTYELKYRFKTVLEGAFGPELLRVGSYWQHLYPAGGGWVYQLYFRPEPPATMVHERYAEGIPLYESRKPAECLEQAAELLKVLKYDPAEIEARIEEVVVAGPEGGAKAVPAEGDPGAAPGSR